MSTETTGLLLREVRGFLRRYVVFSDHRYYDAVTLWALHAHAIGAAETTPRLIFKSPEKESGKTRALEVLEVLTPAPLFTMNVTIAAVFRLLKEETATILFDEVDAIFGTKAARENEDLRALLNAGYRRGATVPRVVGEGKKMRVERFPVFAATALAAIGDLPDTIESRALIVPMKRRAAEEAIESFRRRRVNGEAEEWKQDLEAWATVSAHDLGERDPAMPDGVTDRAADCWEPLLAIADLAGGEWPERARAAATFLVCGREAEDQSTGVRLLSDIHTLMAESDRLSSEELCRLLNGLEESPWGGWSEGRGISPRDLARRLKAYSVAPKVIRLPEAAAHRGGTATPRGYLREDFADSWSRYLRIPPTCATGATSATQIRIDVADVEDVAHTHGKPPHDGAAARRQKPPDVHVADASAYLNRQHDYPPPVAIPKGNPDAEEES